MSSGDGGGGFLFIRHNEIHDSTAYLHKEICHDICIEPDLQPLNGETMSYCSAVEDYGARLDIAAIDNITLIKLSLPYNIAYPYAKSLLYIWE